MSAFVSLGVIGILAVVFSVAIVITIVREDSQEARRREGQTRAEREAGAAEEEAAKRQAVKEYLLRFAFTCPRCQEPALPIPDTGNRYHCPDCGHQFAADPHMIPSEDYCGA